MPRLARFTSLLAIAITTTILITTTSSTVLAQSLPVVDLGYVRQQATAINSTGAYYNFSNIRYAEPPTGARRFALPVSPSTSNSSIDDGSVPRICPQASTAWASIQFTFLVDYLLGSLDSFNFTASNATAFSTPVPAQGASATEDCLFLDVMVPQNIFDGNTSAPVLVWIYGGGFVAGSKAGAGNPAGLIKASQANGEDGIIFVAMNYRLGALGWLAGSTLEASGVANAGLYDQRLALEWVQNNIHLFGGDPSRVTVMGESAGATSILHQITAFGNSSVAPFQRAIMQSPAFQPQNNPVVLENTAQDFFSILGVTSIEEARGKDSAAVIQANSQQVFNSLYGSFTYGPVVDGLITPALPGQLLYENRFSKNISVMVAHNQNEGLLFSDPEVTNGKTYSLFIQTAAPSISLSALAYIENVLYPEIYTNEAVYGYHDEFTRYVQTLSEFAVTCNTAYIESAFANNTYSYEFTVYPALHGEDTSYTFWNGETKDVFTLPLNGTIAQAFQEYLTSFATTGVPSAADFPTFQEYGSSRNVLQIKSSSITQGYDDVNQTRCAFWQQGLLDGQDVSVDGVGIDEPPATVVIMTASQGASTYTASVPDASSPMSPVPDSGMTVTGNSTTTSTSGVNSLTTSASGVNSVSTSITGTTTATSASSSTAAASSATATAYTGAGAIVQVTPTGIFMFLAIALLGVL